MIVCQDCGSENADNDEWCGACGKNLAVFGKRVAPTPPVAATPEGPAEERFRSTKKLLEVDNASLAAQDADAARVARDDAAHAASVEAQRLAAQAQRQADEADAARRAAEEVAARRAAEMERERELAAGRAADADRALAEMRVKAEADEKRRLDETAAAQAAAAEATAARVQAAQEQARVEAATAQAVAARALAEQERVAQAAQRSAAAAADAAQESERLATQAREAAQHQLQEAVDAASAAALRTLQEHDALASADAARLASEAESARARAEVASAQAQAAEDVARARSEAEAAKAEMAELRAKAQADAARTELDRLREKAEREAADLADRARRKVEEDAEAHRVRELAASDAAALKRAAESQLAEQRAQAEIEARQAELKAAAARAEADRIRAEAEAAAKKREHQLALRQAERLLADQARPKVEAAGPTRPTEDRSKKSGKTPTVSTATGSVLTGTGPERPTDEAVANFGTGMPGKGHKPAADLNPGDVVCGACGTGNVPARKFCRRCGKALTDAKPAKVGFFARLRSRRRKKREMTAGTRPGRGGAKAGSIRDRGREGWWRVNSSLMRIGAMLGVLALLGFGVEPIRAKLKLPNVRQTIFDKLRSLKPIYDAVQPIAATASPVSPGQDPQLMIDLGNNTSWMAAPSVSGGVGTTVTISFEKPFDLSGVLVSSGLAGTEAGKGFVSQPRPSEFRVVFNDDVANPVSTPLTDTDKPQQLKLKHKEVLKVAFEVMGVYPASDGKGRSVAITEFEFRQRRKFGDNYETLTPPKIEAVPVAGLDALTDGDLSTAWMLPGDGVQGFSIVFPAPIDLDRIRIAPGQAEATFQAAGRPHEIQLAFTCDGRCDATKQVTFTDKPGYKDVGMSATGVRRIDVVVRSVYGDSNAGTAFADLQFQRKRPKAE